MLAIQPLRTPRLQVNLHELAMGDSIYLCKIPIDQRERGTGELLNRIVDKVDKPLSGQIISPRLWTVQERAFIVAHYLAHIVDGGPNFKIGDHGSYEDYLTDLDQSCPESIEVGEISGEKWHMRPLLGGFSESIERLIVMDELSNDREGWLVGCMAAQLFKSSTGGFNISDAMDSSIDEYVSKFATELLLLPESEFLELLGLYMDGCDKLDHIFYSELSDFGIVWMPSEREVSKLPSARFQFSLAVRRTTEELFGLPDRRIDGDDAISQSADELCDADDIDGRERNLREQGIYIVEKNPRA